MSFQTMSWLMSLLISLVSACTSVHLQAPIPWIQESVSGLTIRLRHPSIMEELSFSKEGYVAVSMGQVGGPIAGPIYRWSIIDGRLEIGEGEGTEQLTLLSRSASVIVVRRRSGQVVEYDIIKIKL